MSLRIHGLQSIYERNQAVRCILYHLRGTEKRHISTIDSIYTELLARGENLSKAEISGAFQLLEDSACGEYRHSSDLNSASFEWHYPSNSLDEIAQTALMQERAEFNTVIDEDTEYFLHTLVLRPHLKVSLELPSNMTGPEAERLAEFVKLACYEVPNDATGLIEHFYYLRPNLQIKIALPVDLTSYEATRVGHFIWSACF